MSMDPQMIQMLLARYKSQFPQQGAQQGQSNPLAGFDAAQQSLSAGAPPGTNRTAGGVNAAAQLIVAMMRARKQQQLQQQLQQQQNQQPAMPTPSQGITPGGGVDSSASPSLSGDV